MQAAMKLGEILYKAAQEEAQAASPETNTAEDVKEAEIIEEVNADSDSETHGKKKAK